MYSTHLHRALVQERFAVVEEVDASERRPDLVDHLREDAEVEHAGLTRPGDAGFRRAARLVARDVAGRGAFDEHAPGVTPRVERAHGRFDILRERPFQRAVAAEGGTGAVEVFPERGDDGTAPDLFDRRGPGVTEYSLWRRGRRIHRQSGRRTASPAFPTARCTGSAARGSSGRSSAGIVPILGLYFSASGPPSMSSRRRRR